jgi:hypothetical protein
MLRNRKRGRDRDCNVIEVKNEHGNVHGVWSDSRSSLFQEQGIVIMPLMCNIKGMARENTRTRQQPRVLTRDNISPSVHKGGYRAQGVSPAM